MSKGTTIKEAIAKFEEREGCKASEQKHVNLMYQIPFIEKMDASLSTLAPCIKLSLSTNQIEKIANLSCLQNLQILSLARNSIKSLTGLESVGDTLLELWISYNRIEKLKGINVLRKLQVLYIGNNEVKDKAEFDKLAELQCLTELNFAGNPYEAELQLAGTYRDYASKKLSKVMKLDGQAVIRPEVQEEE